MSEIYGSDAYAPREVAQRVEQVGVVKARLPLLPLAMLGVLAGAFIGSVHTRADPIGHGVARIP